MVASPGKPAPASNMRCGLSVEKGLGLIKAQRKQDYNPVTWQESHTHRRFVLADAHLVFLDCSAFGAFHLLLDTSMPPQRGLSLDVLRHYHRVPCEGAGC